MSLDNVLQPHIGVFGAIGWHALANVELQAMDMVINGAGYDLALAFASLQVPTLFASSVSDGKTMELMRMDLEEHGLQDMLLRVPGLTFTGSVAWYEHGQERLMRAHPCFDVEYPESFLVNLVQKCPFLLVELGFSTPTLQCLHREARAQQKTLLWVARSRSDWEKLMMQPEWQDCNVFVGPHAYEYWPDYIHQMAGLKQTGFAAMTKQGNTLMVWKGDTYSMLPVAEPTVHAEYRFANILAAVVNEMTAWQVPLADAAGSCAEAFEDWVDRRNTDGADLERKVATFYKKVESLEHDALTGLLSRGAAEKILGGKQFEGPVSMILVDVDHFKRVNDTLGHHIGDVVLRQVAGKIAGQTRDKDLAVRWGGEEFVIFLPGCPLERAGQIAERIRGEVRKVSTELGSVTASFGVTERVSRESLDDWFIRTDSCLYAAKNGGRDQVIVG